ncbi:MAG: S8 family serine peptidase [Bacteroidia bacterium]|nr:S8 family peptidase [Bacteroidia bacterium]MDW8157645.1 S8 family serine peptidase [Bacteroidia bacterium]
MTWAQVTLSPYSQKVVKDVLPYLQESTNKKEIVLPQSLIDEYLIKQKKGVYCVGAIIEVDAPSVAQKQLEEQGIKVRTRAGNIWTVDIPISAFPTLKMLKGVKYVQIDHKINTKLKEARRDSRVDAVHLGTNLPQNYTGKGVIVGVIDAGMDFTHPTFRISQNLSRLRIQRAWVQAKEGGTPPEGFDYGSEYIGQQALLNQRSDEINTSHGTHVAGIAAGIGDTQTDDFKGYAPDADIVLVSINGAGSNIIDAVQYIFSYAQKVGKPAVINMSLGSHIGPHDGTSLFDRAFKELVGSGRILVGAAGNEGMFPMHLSHNFRGDTIYTIAHTDLGTLIAGQIRLEMWGPKEGDFSVNIMLLDRNGRVLQKLNRWYRANDTTRYDTSLRTGGLGSLRITKTSTATWQNFNNKANMQINLRALAITNAFVGIAITAPGGVVHVWNDGMGNGAPLLDSIPATGGVKLHNFRRGDNSYTTSEIGGTGEAVITVGAYTTKNKYIDIEGREREINARGELGSIAIFSSRGPTVDGRTKPEITAPGNVVASAFSSFDNGPLTMPTARVKRINFENKDYFFGVYEGTSMASPCVAGTVALMLQANSNLTPEKAKEILMTTATQDNFTGTTPNNTWGSGKLNAYESVRLATSVTSMPNIYFADHLQTLLFPNPAQKIATLSYSISKLSPISIKINDNLGRAVFENCITPEDSKGSCTLPLETLAPGFYTVVVWQENAQNIIKMVIE